MQNFFFHTNCLADKIKLGAMSNVPDNFKLVQINDYLEKDVKSMLFSYFCFKCMKINCSLDNPLEIINFRRENIYH